MSFNSLNHVLGAIENQAGWEQTRQFRHLQQCWADVVGLPVAQHTRVQSMSRGVLWVATSSSVWVSNLTLQRHLILKKLNARLTTPLTDVRFSTAQWHKDTGKTAAFMSPLAGVGQDHPSYVVAPSSGASTPPVSKLKDPGAAFRHWAEELQKRSHSLPLCPQCQCPTPSGELARWDVCALCATKRWKN
jgi:predicted nucleic acid-binding Zn ribbon protein